VYCCGPSPLLDAIEDLSRAWPAYVLHTERFVAKEQPAPALATPFEVVLSRTGRTVTVPLGSSVLATVREAGVAVLSSCRQGTCGTCETTVLEGTPDHRDSVLSDHERAAGDCMLVCVSRSRTERLVLDL
jgi:ferredoxin